jgi:hypothetical protein
MGVVLRSTAQYNQGGTLNVTISNALVDVTAPDLYSQICTGTLCFGSSPPQLTLMQPHTTHTHHTHTHTRHTHDTHTTHAAMSLREGSPVWRQASTATLKVVNGTGTCCSLSLSLSWNVVAFFSKRRRNVWAGVMFVNSPGAAWQQLASATITIQGNATGSIDPPPKSGQSPQNADQLIFLDCTLPRHQASIYPGEANGPSKPQCKSPPSHRAPPPPAPKVGPRGSLPPQAHDTHHNTHQPRHNM